MPHGAFETPKHSSTQTEKKAFLSGVDPVENYQSTLSTITEVDAHLVNISIIIVIIDS